MIMILDMPKTFEIVNRRFSPSEFQEYINNLALTNWTPDKVVLHNTAVPTLAKLPNGFDNETIENLHGYYQNVVDGGKGWSGGPHLFVDQNGIWVFNPLDRAGVHSPSWNPTAWGVEMLGDFAKESFDSGDGLKVQNNALAAVTAMFRKLKVAKLTTTNFHLHKEDPKTDHDCPGKNVHREAVVAKIQALLDSPTTSGTGGLPVKVIVYRKGAGQSPAAVVSGLLRNGTTFADRVAMAAATGLPTGGTGLVAVREFVGAHYSLTFDSKTSKLYLGEL